MNTPPPVPSAIPPELPAQKNFYHKAANAGVIALLGSFAINLIGSASPERLVKLIFSVTGGVFVLTAIVCGVIALWGVRKYGKRGLLIKGLCASLIPVVLIALAIPAFYQVRKVAVELQIRREVESANKTLPQKIDEVTTLTRIVRRGSDAVVMEHKLGLNGADIDRAKWESSMKPLILQGCLRNGAIVHLLKNGITIHYRYTCADEVVLSEISVQPGDLK